jgi:hypothetical protein
MDTVKILDALNTVSGIIAIASPPAGAALGAISNLIGLATAAAATAADAKHAWDLIQGHADGSVEIDEIEAKIEELEARGLKPVAPPED